jgi:hypothetical protein
MRKEKKRNSSRKPKGKRIIGRHRHYLLTPYSRVLLEKLTGF